MISRVEGGKIAGRGRVVHSVLPAISRRAFALASGAFRSPARRRFALTLGSAMALGVLAIQPAQAPAPVRLATTPVATSPWLDRVNQWRAGSGLPALTEDTTMSAGDAAHALYMVKNNAVTHSENPALPYYTTAGDIASQNSNIQVSSSTATTDADAIDWWMAAPFHAIGMMDPLLATTGFGSYRDAATSPWQEGAAFNTNQGRTAISPRYPVYFPGNGTTEPLTNYSGNEFPDPLSACSGYTLPVGLPVVIQVGSNIATTAGVHAFTGNGTPLAHCVIDSSTTVGSGLAWRGGVILIPRAPLQTGVNYGVTLTVNGTTYTWSFTVGPFFGVSAITPNSGPATGATAVTITGTGFTGATAVKFGSTAATSVSVVNDSTITAVSPAHAAGTVDVTVTKPAGTSPASSSDQFTYAPCTAITGSGSPAPPAAAGTQVTITGVATGCASASPLYEFWMQPSGSSSWTKVQDYSTSASYGWNSTGALAGTEHFGVWVRDAASVGISCNTGMGCYDAFISVPYAVTNGGVGGSACTLVTTSASPDSPTTSGTQVTLNGTAAGCPNPRYEFWMKAGTNAWQLLQGYSTSAYAWNSTGALAGTEMFGVWVRDASSLATYDTYASLPFSITTTACASVTATASPTTVVHGSGTQVTITGVGAGCANARYEFWMKAGANSWQLLQGYSPNSTYVWNTTGALTGSEVFGVWVRDAASSAAYDTYYSLPFNVT